MESIHVIRRPLLTEKSTIASSEHNRYTFMVAPEARKGDIKKAVEDLYKVRVISVNTVTRHGRTRRLRYGWVPGKYTKRAIVRIHPDDTIELV